MNEENVVNSYNDILFVNKKDEVLIHSIACMNLGNMLSERS